MIAGEADRRPLSLEGDPLWGRTKDPSMGMRSIKTGPVASGCPNPHGNESFSGGCGRLYSGMDQRQEMVTSVLARVQRGDGAATEELFPLVYDELRSIAARYLAGERQAHTLQPTELVNEAFMRLVGPGEVEWESRAHFFGAAARAIRRILTDHARTKNRAKRGAGARKVSLDEAETIAVGDNDTPDFVELDRALEKLSTMDEQKAKVVELRFFGGLTAEQTAAALGISESTVHRDWQFSRAWLHRELGESGDPA